MTREEIRTLRDKIGTDPILTDEEIEYIWIAMDKQASMKPNERSCELDREYGYCPSCDAVVCDHTSPKVCWRCGQKLDWEDEE